MKNLLTLFILFLGLGITNAQEKKKLTFDETVLYLKSNLEEKARYSHQGLCHHNGCSTVMLNRISISTDGQITCSFVKFDELYPSITFNLNKVLKIENKYNEICFFIAANSFYIIQIEAQIDLERLTKAFNHLKSLLPKEPDPFGE